MSLPTSLDHAPAHPADAAPPAPEARRLRAAARATRLVFLVLGLAVAAWAPLVPVVKSKLSLDDGMLGLLLLGIGGGAMVFMPVAGFLTHRHGTRPVMLVGGLLSCLALPLLLVAPTIPLLALALVLFGAALGAIDVAVNAHAVVVERQAGRPLMSGFHGLYSAGGLAGALGMSALLALDVDLVRATVAISVILAVILVAQGPGFLSPQADRDASDRHTFALPRGSVLPVGLLCFIAFLAEGAVLDWSAVFLRFSRGLDIGQAGLGYAAFSLAMTAGRLFGDRITARIGPRAILRWGGLIAAMGFVLAVLVPSGIAGMLGFALVGIGASNIVPVLFSTAGRLPGMSPSVAMAAVTTVGYAGLLAGPAAIGFAAELTTLGAALLGVAGLCVLVALCARVAR